MKNRECLNCIERKNCEDSFTAWIFFIIGLVATIAIRVVTVLIHVNPLYGKIAWYTGVVGFFLFFIYKFRINQKRSDVIKQKKLLDKISEKRPLDRHDYDLIGAILCSLTSRKERINYLFIFSLSAIAIILALYFDFIR